MWRPAPREGAIRRGRRAALLARRRPARRARRARWSVDGPLEVIDGHVRDGVLRTSSYPDALARVWAALTCPTSGDVLLSAAPGWEFPDWGGVDHVGGGSHGSLHRSDSLGALAFCGVAPPDRDRLGAGRSPTWPRWSAPTSGPAEYAPRDARPCRDARRGRRGGRPRVPGERGSRRAPPRRRRARRPRRRRRPIRTHPSPRRGSTLRHGATAPDRRAGAAHRRARPEDRPRASASTPARSPRRLHEGPGALAGQPLRPAASRRRRSPRSTSTTRPAR